MNKLMGVISLMEPNKNQVKKLNKVLRRKIGERSRIKYVFGECGNYFKAIFENTGTAIVILDQDMKILMVNLKAEELSGYCREELIGVNALEIFVHPDYIEEVQRNYSLSIIAPNRTPQDYEIKCINKHGQSRDCILNATTIPNSKNLVVSIINVTDRKETEGLLIKSERRFREVFENTSDGIFLVDVTPEGRFYYAGFNPAMEKAVGMRDKEVTGKSIYEVLSPKVAEFVAANYQSCIERGIPISYKEVLSLSTGERTFFTTLIPVYQSCGRIYRIIGVARDITEIRQAEEALKYKLESQSLLFRISQNFTRVVAENIDEMINLSLKQIAEFDNDDRCYVFLFSDDGSTISNTHEWCREGIKAKKDNLQCLPTDLMSWWLEKLQNFEHIFIPQVNALPPEAQAEKEILQAQAIQSLMAVPMTYERKLIGFLGLDSVRTEKNWSEDSISLFNIVANIFSNALQRKQHINALRDSENYYRTIFENTGTAIIIIEEDMTISKANGEWERSFGYMPKELEGIKWPDLIPEDLKNMMEDYHYLRRVDPTNVPTRYNARIKDKAGKFKDCLVIVDMITGTKRSVAACVDLSEYNRINRALKVTSAVNMTMLHAENEQSLLEEVCQRLVDIGGYRFAWVGYLSNEGEQTVLPTAYAGYEAGYLKTLNIALSDSERGNGPTGLAIRTRQPLICRNTDTDPMFIPWRAEASERGYKASIAIPLNNNCGGILGTLNIYSDREDIFDTEEIKLLMEVAGDLAYGISSLRAQIERDQTAKELEKNLEKMHRVLMDTVDSLAASLETRDPYTAGHQVGVALLARKIAEEMGLSAEQIEGVSVAGTLHDIGKIVTPIEILSKPGKISEVEYMLIKGHCQAGYEIIKKIDFPWPIREIVLQHHERLNGSGYPQGLSGDKILLEAKILAVADVVEAMHSHRPYRSALGMDLALAEIAKNKGVLYEPEVVDACLKLFQEKGFTFET